jgi:hypothetical protein
MQCLVEIATKYYAALAPVIEESATITMGYAKH